MELQGATAREYLRVSFDRSGRAKSTTEQHNEDAEIAKRLGVRLGTPYDDVSVSASRYSKKARKGFDQLMADLQNGDFGADVLWLWESSRGSRRVGEWVLMCDLLDERGIRVYVTTHSRLYDPSNPRDRRSLLEDAVDSEYESGKLSHRLKRDGAAAAKEGKPPTRSAFGHPRNRIVNGERVKVKKKQIKAERAAVRRLYEGLFAGKTLVSMAKEMHEAGFRTAQGNDFTRSAARAILLNPRNAGIRYYKGERIAEGQWEAIVSEETWQAAVDMLGDPKRRKNHGTARRWLGGGLYRCGQCNAADMRVNYRDERVYRCRGTGHNSRAADKVDDYVRFTVAQRLNSDDMASLLGPDLGADLSRLHSEAEAYRRKLRQLGAEWAEDNMTDEQIRSATERINVRLAEIDGKLAEIGRRNHLAEMLGQDDPGQAFLDAEVEVQRATVDAICVVTLLPNPRRRWGSMAETVRIEPRSAEHLHLREVLPE